MKESVKETVRQDEEPRFLFFLSYLRSLCAMPAAIAFMIFICSLFCILSLLRQPKLDNFVVVVFAKVVVWLFGIQVRVAGLENIPEGGCLFLFNHSSHFDIPVMYSVINQFKPYRYGAKAELFRIPFFGWTLRMMGALPIHRGDPQRVYELYRSSVQRIAKGESFALAPEGTRQTEAQIGKFKKGPFAFAIQAKAPVVPVLIKGALEILPKGHYVVNPGRWRRTVLVKVLPATATAEFANGQELELQSQVREQMVQAFSSSSNSIN